MKKVFCLLFLICFGTAHFYGCLPPAPEGPEPQILVIFGASGDLTKRKLMPALAKLEGKNQLPAHFVILGVGREEQSDAQFREAVSSFVEERDLEGWQNLAEHVFYLSGDFHKQTLYKQLSTKLHELESHFNTTGNVLFYLATPPQSFSTIIQALHTHHLLNENGHWSRAIIEKPFGHDTDSAITLHEELAHYLDEEQLYLIDHYLGKEVLHNLLAMRFTNFVFDRLWSQESIDHVSITLSEEIGVGTRGSFWEKTGLLRDVVQNHVMQMVSLLAMEKPTHFSPDEIHLEKTRLIESIRPFSEGSVKRGQYGPGIVNGDHVPGYRQETGVAPDSFVETFVEATLWIDNPRWSGVPFHIKAGKRLSKRFTEIAITFKSEEGVAPNELVFRIQPDEAIHLIINSPLPGLAKGTHPIPLSWQFGQLSSATIPDAYERLLKEAMHGDRSNFVSYEEILAAWKLFTPVLREWEANPPQDFPNYPAGSDGP